LYRVEETGGLGTERGHGGMTKAAIIGWVIQSAGVAVCLYGYFSTGNPSIVDWHTIAPSWIADWLPNIQSEIGMTLMFAGMIPIYWPRR